MLWPVARQVRVWPDPHGLEPRSGPLVCGRNPAYGARVQGRVPNVDRIGDQQPALATILHTVCSSKTLDGQCAGVGVNHHGDLATAAAAPDDDGECAREVRPCSRTVAEPRSIGSAIAGTIKENWSHPACEHLGAWIVREIRQSCLLNRRSGSDWGLRILPASSVYPPGEQKSQR
jgi:hypothetical protein